MKKLPLLLLGFLILTLAYLAGKLAIQWFVGSTSHELQRLAHFGVAHDFQQR
jgi:hypothetical protein